MATETYQAPTDTVGGFQRVGMGAALAGVVLTAIGFVLSGHVRFFQAYLVAWVFVFGTVLGAMALLMVQHLSGGAWGIVIRRPLEAAVRTMPIMALLFLPIALGVHDLYHWSHEDAVAADPMLQFKAPYLNATFFYIRQVLYFAIWIAMGRMLTTWSEEQDRTGDPGLVRKLSILSGGGLVVYALTVTFAVVDWTMSVNPHWFSTMWGPLYMAGQGLSALSFTIFVLILLSQTAPLNRVITPHHFHDLGKLLFAFLMLHAYLSFSQFLIIWSANLKEEIPHYLIRWDSGYQYVSLFMIVGHFALPYVLLLSRDIKRDIKRLRLIVGWVVLARIVDYYWHVAPEFHPAGLSLGLLDFAVPIALGGIFLALFAANLKKHALLPVQDPGLPKDQAMADSLRRIQLQPREVWIVKLADRINNLEAPPHYWTTTKIDAYRAEAQVIADALGAASPYLHARLRARIAAYPPAAPL